MKLTDFMTLSQKKFWALVDTEGELAEVLFKKHWKQIEEGSLTQDEAVECLNALFIYSHVRIRKHSAALAKNYPTKQYTPNRLANQEYLWWVDHFTAGISRWSTLNWFSAEKRKKKNGQMGLSGACTHFVQGYHDDPFYIIPLMHGSWNEPRRNKDSISIEHVNAGSLSQNPKNKNEWRYWANALPLALVQELPPVILDKPYRGVRAMQPFTRDQIINNIKLKRLIITALHGKLDPSRMSQHSDWREGKPDMGVLWPFEDCNDAAFGVEPVRELDFIQNYDMFLDEAGDVWNEASTGWDTHNDSNNPEYGEHTPTHDDDPDDDPGKILETKEVQLLLSQKGYTVTVDGIPGPKTRQAIKQFQLDWNKKNPRDAIKADGIPGPETCKRLKNQ